MPPNYWKFTNFGSLACDWSTALASHHGPPTETSSKNQNNPNQVHHKCLWSLVTTSLAASHHQHLSQLAPADVKRGPKLSDCAYFCPIIVFLAFCRPFFWTGVVFCLRLFSGLFFTTFWVDFCGVFLIDHCWILCDVLCYSFPCCYLHCERNTHEECRVIEVERALFSTQVCFAAHVETQQWSQAFCQAASISASSFCLEASRFASSCSSCLCFSSSCHFKGIYDIDMFF